MNISGNWNYKEDFEYGVSIGNVKLFQKESKVSGEFSFIEKVNNNDTDDYELDILEKVEGYLVKDKLLLESISVVAKSKGIVVEYLPNNFELHIVSDTKIVGSTYDSDTVCGVFVMDKIL